MSLCCLLAVSPNDCSLFFPIQPFSYICAASLPLSLNSFILKTLPLIPVPLPDSLPNPIPLISRAATLANESCSVTNLDAAFGAEWYTIRTRLIVAYLTAEIHLLAPSSDIVSSTRVLRDIASAPILTTFGVTTAATAVANAAFVNRPQTTKAAASSRPWPTQSAFGTRAYSTLYASQRQKSLWRMHARRPYSTLPNQFQVVDSFLRPFGHFLATISRIARFITVCVLAAALAALAVFEGTHLYVEYLAMKGPGAVGKDEFEWYAEAEDDSWGSDGGTDSRLGLVGRHALRSAWMCANWGIGTKPELVFRRPATSGADVNTTPYVAGREQADGLALAANFLVKTLSVAEKRGIWLPDIGAMRAGLEIAQQWKADAPLDKTALALETRLASIRERLGTPTSLALAISGYERIYDALSVTGGTHEAVGHSGQTSVPASRLVRLATKLGNLYAQIGKRDEAELWLHKAIELTPERAVFGRAAHIAASGTDSRGSSSSSHSRLAGWLRGSDALQIHAKISEGEKIYEALPTGVSISSASMTRALSGALLSLSAFYAASHSPEETSLTHPNRQSSFLKALSIQSFLREYLLASSKAAKTVGSGASIEKALHQAWIQHALAVDEVHMAEVVFALGAVKSQLQKANEILGSSAAAGSNDPTSGNFNSKSLLQGAAKRAKIAHDSLVKNVASVGSSIRAPAGEGKHSSGGMDGLLPLFDLKESLHQAGAALEMPAAILVRDTRRLRKQCEIMLGILSRRNRE